MEILDKGNRLCGMNLQDKIYEGMYFNSLVSYALKLIWNLEKNGTCNMEKKIHHPSVETYEWQ